MKHANDYAIVGIPVFFYLIILAASFVCLWAETQSLKPQQMTVDGRTVEFPILRK